MRIQNSGVEDVEHNQDWFPFHHTVFFPQIKSKVVNILTKTTVLSINLNIDDVPIVSHTQLHVMVTLG